MQMKKVISMMLTLVLLLGAFVSPGVLPQGGSCQFRTAAHHRHDI